MNCKGIQIVINLNFRFMTIFFYLPCTSLHMVNNVFFPTHFEIWGPKILESQK